MLLILYSSKEYIKLIELVYCEGLR